MTDSTSNTAQLDQFRAQLAEVRALAAKKAAEDDARLAILESLPPVPCLPSISNIKTPSWHHPRAWLSFHHEYGKPPANYFEILEAAGWTAAPTCLAAFSNYSPSPEPCDWEDVPEEKRGSFGSIETLRMTEAIAPLWLDLGNYGSHQTAEAQAFMRAPDGLIYRVSVPVSDRNYRVTATRTEYPGGWRFDRNRMRRECPQAAHELRNEAGESIGHLSHESRLYYSGEQYLRAPMYWSPIVDSGEFDLSPAAILDYLLSL